MSGFPIEVATRIKTRPPYLFAAIDKMKQAAIAEGVDIINLGIGDPVAPTPAPITESLGKAAKDPKHHQYPAYEGMLSFAMRWPTGTDAASMSARSGARSPHAERLEGGHREFRLHSSIGRYRARPEPRLSSLPVGTSFAGDLASHATHEAERVCQI